MKNMKKHSKILALTLALFALLSFAACSPQTPPADSDANPPADSDAVNPPESASQALESIKSAGKLTISLEGGFEPFEYYEGSDIVGMDIDIANYISEKWGVALEIQDMEFNSALTAVSTGVVDLSMSGISWTEERSKEMEFSDPYFSSNQLIVVRADSDIKSKDDLIDKKIGAQAGTTGEDMAIEFVGEANVSGYDKYVMAVQDLKNGQIDAIIMDAFPAKSHVKANEGQIIDLPEPLGVDSYCIAIKKGNTELLDEVNAVLDEMRESGILDEIINKYKSALEG